VPQVQASQSLSLRPATRGDGESPRAELIAGGRSTGVVVPGVTLEAQYEAPAWQLLFTTENIPFEEALHITLLDRQFARLDHVELSHPFTPGAVTGLEASDGADRVKFSFFGGDLWEVTVLRVPRRLARREAPTGVKARLKRLLMPRYLAVERLR
jgi:hypothetical protein